MQITMDQSNFKVIYDSKCSITYTLFIIENRYCLQLLVSVKPKIVCDITSERPPPQRWQSKHNVNLKK